MALTAEQIEQYGLTKVDGGSIDDGVVKSGSNYYKLNNFERQQNEKLDSDQGDVFSSSLEADSGVDYSNFNTINDVQGAIQQMEGNAPKEEVPIEYSPEVQQAHDIVNTWESDVWSGQQSQDIFGQQQNVKDGAPADLGKQQKEAANNLADNYISNIKRDVEAQLTQGISI